MKSRNQAAAARARRAADKSGFSIPFTSLKNKVLSQGYQLSLVFVDTKFSKRLNRIYRGKDRPANVLSFPLSKRSPDCTGSGEIFIDLVTSKKEFKKFNMTFQKFVEYLYIHALLHLKGMRHGVRMEKLEQKLLHDASNHNRH